MTQPPSSMRGFVIATDGLIALAILFALLGLAFNAASHQGEDLEQRSELRSFLEHATKTLEQAQLAQRAAILNSTTEIRSFVNAWPTSVCGKVELFPSVDTNTPLLFVTKSGCTTPNAGIELVRRGFIVPSPPDANLYVMEVSAWPREG